MKQPVVLRIYRGDQLFGVKQFQNEQIVLGRQSELQVALDDDKVASIHAAIEERDSGYYICDLGSETGTFRNGEQVLDAKLESGDLLQIGDFKIEFFVGVPKPKGAPNMKAPDKSEPTPASPAQAAPVQPKQTERPSALSVSPPPAEKVPEKVPEKVVEKKPVVRPAEPAKPAVVMMSGSGGGLEPARDVLRPRSRQIQRESKKGKTFAPPSKYKSHEEFIKPSKGTVVELLVVWRERVIGSYHFSGKKVVTVGPHPDNDVVIPVMNLRQRRVPVLQFEPRPIVLVSPEMTGALVRGQQTQNFAELIRQGRMVKVAGAEYYALGLEQGELMRLELHENLSLIVRFTSDSPKPLVAPLFDLTAAEVTGVLMSLVLMAVLGLYLFLYTPPTPLDEDKGEDPLRMAKVKLQAPRPQPQPDTAAPVPTPPPVPTKPEKVQLEKENRAAQKKAETVKTTGAASNVAPNKNKTGPKRMTSVKQGGAIKTSKVEGAQMSTPKKDLTKMGIFSTFGKSGQQDQTAQGYRGAGDLVGEANSATGKAGQSQDRPGQGIGSALKDTGRGGTGTAAVGVPGVTTRGRGGGAAGYGTGAVGQHRGTQVIAGGVEESFSGTIDREVIRRVIVQNQRVLKTCYERELNRNPDLAGKIILEWDIGEQGRVVGTRKGKMEPGFDRVAECILDRLRTWRFPEPPANQAVTVQFPFVFQ